MKSYFNFEELLLNLLIITLPLLALTTLNLQHLTGIPTLIPVFHDVRALHDRLKQTLHNGSKLPT
jgi:hypothetical protein